MDIETYIDDGLLTADELVDKRYVGLTRAQRRKAMAVEKRAARKQKGTKHGRS